MTGILLIYSKMTTNITGKKISLYLAFLGIGKKNTIENVLKLPSLENTFTRHDVLTDAPKALLLRNLKCYDSEN